MKQGRAPRVVLASAPIEVAQIFREKIFDRIPSVILTSATLSVGGPHGFDFFKDRYGFPVEHGDDPDSGGRGSCRAVDAAGSAGASPSRPGQSSAAIQLGSPFDYRRQAELHLFRQMPDPTADTMAFEEACCTKIQEYVLKSQGQAFVLFTSYSFLRRAAESNLFEILKSQLALKRAKSPAVRDIAQLLSLTTRPSWGAFGHLETASGCGCRHSPTGCRG